MAFFFVWVFFSFFSLDGWLVGVLVFMFCVCIVLVCDVWLCWMAGGIPGDYKCCMLGRIFIFILEEQDERRGGRGGLACRRSPCGWQISDGV